MKQIILFLNLILCLLEPIKAQTNASCQNCPWHRVMQKKMKLVENAANSDSIQIVLHTSVPPIEWWNPYVEIGKRGNEIVKKENPNRGITRLAKHNVQKFVEIINTSGSSIIFIKPDKSLMLGLQAKNETGEWQDVEEFFVGLCGRSFKSSYNDTIRPNQAWLTFVEVFTGKIKTKYRLKLLTKLSDGVTSRHYYYSNEIDGTIDECKFIRKYVGSGR
jgi:hypothetical protein